MLEETKKHHRVIHTPDGGDHTRDGIKKAIVLGAREGNIGGAIAEKLCHSGWVACEDDCYLGPLPMPEDEELFFNPGYRPPQTKDLENYDACVITLGATHMEPFSEVSRADFRKVIYGSLELPLECARRYVRARNELASKSVVAGYRKGMRHSTIVFIGSFAHDHPFTHCTSYCVAKAGLDMAAKTLAWELMLEGFDVYIVHPHHVQGTPMTDEIRLGMQTGVHNMTLQQAIDYQHKDLRMPELLKPSEIADIVFLLLTQPAMRWLNGQAISLYGGMR